jgi:hypothetical protein
MSRFLQSEKIAQVAFKQTSPDYSEGARAFGRYKKYEYPFCLPRAYAEENLLPEIRKTAREHFAHNQIKWHDGQEGMPSNHLCDSQVCCVNFLFPFADKPDELAALLRPVFPKLKHMLPIECGRYVTFEWIGLQNYLGERISRNGKRTRGANFTSADAAVRFECEDGTLQTVLIEWKYTESYSTASLATAKSGTDRTAIYAPLYQRPDCPLKKELLPAFNVLFYEPFYQLMRQQFLVHEMQKAHEMGASRVALLHIAPAANPYFQRVTSAQLAPLGAGVTAIWRMLVQPPGAFVSISTEALFGPMWSAPWLALREWRDYVGARYRWMQPVTV